MTTRFQFHLAGHALLIMGALACSTPTTAVASFPGADGVIAYSAAHTSHPGIWAVDPSTGDQLRLTAGATDDAPSFSASGNTLAFQRREGTGETIYIARADGSDATPLTRGDEPAFSPDGRQIVFVRPTGLFILALASGMPAHQITDHRGDRRPVWSATGEIVFQRTDVWRQRYGDGTREELDIIAPPSSHVDQVLTYDEDAELWPEWSPDGKTVALDVCKEKEPFPPPRGLPASIPSFNFGPSCLPRAWSPDGRRLMQPGELMGDREWGLPETTCPRYIPREEDPFGFYEVSPGGEETREPESPVEISWQPLVNGTMQLHTVPCEPRKSPGVKHLSGEGAPPVEPGVRICVRPRRTHSRRPTCRR